MYSALYMFCWWSDYFVDRCGGLEMYPIADTSSYPLPVKPVYAATASCEDGAPPLRRRLSDQTVLRPSVWCPLTVLPFQSHQHVCTNKHHRMSHD
jgi:hypothetical protein